MVSETIALNETWLSSSQLCCRQRVRHNMKAFLRRKPLDDYTPDYTVCQLDFDLVDASHNASGCQPSPDRSIMIRLRGHFGCINANAPRSCRPAVEDRASLGPRVRGKKQEPRTENREPRTIMRYWFLVLGSCF